MTNLVAVSSTDTEWVELSATVSGRLFKKQILRTGPLVLPKSGGKKYNITKEFLAEMVKNFDSGVVPTVQVPLVNKDNEHTDDPKQNTGFVTKLELSADGKLYAYIDARKHAEDFGKTIVGCSAMFYFSGYEDSRTGEKLNTPVLAHVALTNRPWVHGLEDFESVSLSNAAGEDVTVLEQSEEETTEEGNEVAKNETSDENADLNNDTVLPGENAPVDKEIKEMTKEELIELLKTEHGIDVADLTEKAALSNTLSTALADAGAVKLSHGSSNVSSEEIVTAVVALATNNVTLGKENVELSNAVKELKTESATKEVEALVEEGRILPAAKDGMIELKLSNPALFDQVVPAEPVVKLSQENGTSEEPDANLTPAEKAAKEVERIMSQHKNVFTK